MRRLLLPFLALLVSSCGHPATVKECEAILETMARLELQETLGAKSKDLVAREISDAKRALKENTLNDCVGKRITDSALACVQNAASAQDAEDCFN